MCTLATLARSILDILNFFEGPGSSPFTTTFEKGHLR